MEDFSIENVRSQLAEALKIAGGSGSEADIAEAKIEIEVSLSDGSNIDGSNIAPGFGELASRLEVKWWFRWCMREL